MSGFDKTVTDYLNTIPKPGNIPGRVGDKYTAVADASARKQAAMQPDPTPDEMYRIASARANQNGTAIDGVVQDDVRRLDPYQLSQKYGDRRASDLLRGYSRASSDLQRDSNAGRSGYEAFQDSVGAFTIGGVNAVASIPAIALGAVNKDAGLWASNQLQSFTDSVQSQQSDGLQSRRRANAAVNQNDSADSTRQFKNDVAAGKGEFVSSLKRIGRDAYSSVANAASDGTILSDGIANAIGSFAAIGPMAKGLSTVGRSVLKATGAGSTRAGALLASAGSKVTAPALIGGTEAGGAYQQASQEAMQLLADRTDISDERKAELANQAGLEAAAITAPGAIAAGFLTDKFIRNPFGARSTKGIASNLLRETAEEALQGAGSQLATNRAIQDQIDGTRDLSEGVGEQVGLGALYGLGTAGVVQTPNAAAVGTVAAAKLTKNAVLGSVSRMVKAFDNRVSTVNNTVESNSPVSRARVDNILATKVEAAPMAQAETVRAINENTDLTPEKKTETLAYVDEFFNNVNFDPVEADSLPPVLSEAIRPATNRFDAINRVADIAANAEEDPQNRLMAGIYLENTLNKYEDLVGNQLYKTIEQIPDEHPALPELRKFEDVAIRLQEHPGIREAIQAARQFASIPVEQVSEQAIATPEGQQAVQNAVEVAAINPAGSNPETNKQILLHEEQGRIQLTPEQRSFLQTAADLDRVDQEYKQAAEKIKLSNTEIVSRQIQFDKNNVDSTGPSAAEHLSGVFKAVRAGNIDLAKERMDSLVKFAQSMTNKVAALNANLASGNPNAPTPFEAFNPRTGKAYNGKGVFLKGSSASSIRQAQQTALDAKAVRDVANSLARSFPQLGFASIEPVDLLPSMMAPAEDAARAYYEAQKIETRRKARQDQIDQRAEDDRKLRNTTVSDTKVVETPSTVDTSETVDDVQQSEQSVPDNAEAILQEKAIEFEREAVADRLAARNTEPKAQSQNDSRPDRTSVESPQQSQVQNQDQSQPQERDQPRNQEPRVVDEEAPASPIVQTYPNLLGSKNAFYAAFTLPVEAISRLTGEDAPVERVRKALSSGTEFRKMMEGRDTGHKLTEEVSEAYGKLLSKAGAIRNAMNAQLNAALNDKKNTKFIAENPEWNLGPKFRSANIADQNNQYNRQLQASAILAGMQWLLSADQRQRPLKDEDVSKLTGIKVTDVTTDMVEQFNQGAYYDGGVIDLTAAVKRFWGVKTNPNTDLDYTVGVPEGVAKEIIRAMEAVGLIEVVSFDINNKTYRQIAFKTREVFNEETVRGLKAMPSAIENLAIVEPEEVTFIGSRPTTAPNNQLRNPMVKLTAQQRQMWENETKTPFYVNKPMLDFVSALGTTGAVALFGHGDLDNRVMNNEYKKSLDSVNKTIYAAVETILDTVSEVQNKADTAGVDLTEMPIHYNYEFTSVNRLQMVGKHNPQANKLTRELFMPTRSTLDLSNQNNDDMSKFMLGIAQAWGVKVHKQKRAVSVADARAMATGKYAPVIEMLKTFMERSQIEQTLEFTNEQIQQIRSAMGNGPVSPVALYAAMEYARLDLAKDKSQFTTSLYVEADGITDGPMNAMQHTAGGQFTENWLDIMRKGGLYFGQPGATSNDQGNIADLYQVTADAFKNGLKDIRLQLIAADNINALNQMDAMLRLSSELIGDISYDSETREISVSRNAVKNPLTVVIYGAGKGGIADKITSSVTKAVYQKFSDILEFRAANPKGSVAEFLYPDLDPKEAAKRLAQLSSDVSAIVGKTVITNKGEFIVADSKADINTIKITSEFKFDAAQTAAIKRNIQTLLVEPLSVAIDENIGETATGTELLRQATQVQGIYAQYAFQRELQKARAKGPLTAKVLTDIQNKMKYISPFVETGTQNMMISGSERVGIKTPSGKSVAVFSRTLDDKNSTGAYTFGPMDPGVSGIPKTTIGTGDGQMMQNGSTMEGAPEGTLKIFDGMNMKLSTIEEDSRKINEAVYRGWMENPMSAVADSFSNFMRDAGLDIIDEEQREALSEALNGQGKKGASAEDILSDMKALEVAFQNHAKQAQARHNVMRRVALTVDHMASAEGSYDAEGMSLVGMDDRQVVQKLNELYTEEHNKIDATPTPFENISSELGNVEMISADNLLRFVNALNIPADQKRPMLDAARNLRDSNWVVRTGSAQDINLPETVKGATDFNTKSMYVFNGSAETLLHEMIHASTLDKLNAYYANPNSLIREQRDAIQRIEGLMDQFITLEDDISDLNQETKTAYQNAIGSINKYRGVDPAAALNEFMAWTLSNQSLARVAQRTKVSNSLVRIAKDVLQALKELIWGRAKAPTVSDDLYSNLRFNTSILMQTAPAVNQALSDTILFQSEEFGNDARLTELGQKYFDKVARFAYDQPNPAARLIEQQKTALARLKADAVSGSYAAHGFPMNMQQKTTFEMMLTAFATDVELDPNALVRAQELFAHVSKTLKVEDFMKNAETNSEPDRYQAQEKYNSILGNYLTEIDEGGRSSLLPAFMALATVDPTFRDVLSRMDLPKGDRAPNDSLDNRLTNMASEAMDRLSILMSGEKRNSPSVKVAIDALTDRVAEIGQDRQNFITQFMGTTGNYVDAANSWIVDTMQNLSAQGSEKLKQVNTGNKYKDHAAEFGRLLLGIVNEEVAGDVARAGMSALNQSGVWTPIHELFNELVGRTEENKDVYDLIKQVRSAIQSTRQQFREHLPELIQKQFTREVSDPEWTAMHNAMGKTDLASLRSSYSVAQIVEFLTDPAKVQNEAKTIENRLSNKLHIKKARELAVYMNTGKAPINLLRNANAIANLYGEGSSVEVNDTLVKDLDHLMSLYALEGVNQEDKATLASLVQAEGKGVSFVLSYLEGRRNDELQGISNNPRALINHYKGYIPSEQKGGISLKIADDTEYAELVKRGYQRVADYVGSEAEYGKKKRGYYFSPLSGQSSYNQGILQTVHTTVSGVNPATGFTTATMTGGRITDPAMISRTTALLKRQKNRNEALLPVYDENGEVTAYERSVDPVQLERLSRDTNIAKSLGVWRGRQVEEQMATRFNETLIDKLHDTWERDKKNGRRNEYIDLTFTVPRGQKDTLDPVTRDAVHLIPFEIRGYIEEKFGTNSFPVRKDMLNDALGYRAASVGDVWTGNTRYSETTQKNIRDLATGVFGVNAYKRMVQGEKFIQNRVTDARVLIVVKSVIVPVTNLIANVYQLSARGVPIANSIKGMPKKTAEIDSYVKSRIRKIELEGLLGASGSDIVAQRKYNAEIQSIEDSWKRLSVWPLIEAGEFASVSDVGIGKEEIDITEGRLTEYVERLVDRLPEGLKTLAKYGIVSKDTALFKGLQRTIEYGDFLAKAILFDDLTKRQGMSPAEAMGKVTEEFVNYDRLPGRSRNYLESLGLTWFWNFKIRSVKVGLSMIRNNPLHVFLSMMAPTPPLIGSVGNPLTDNILSVTADGRLDNSVGPGQGLHSMQLNPWLQMIG